MSGGLLQGEPFDETKVEAFGGHGIDLGEGLKHLTHSEALFGGESGLIHKD